MARPIERLFVMDEMIRSGDYPSIQIFMQRFDIEERTAYGDIAYLKQHFNAPLSYSRKHGGYYYVQAGWRLTEYESPTAFPEPSRWLWKEIAERFGAEAAQLLQDDYKKWLILERNARNRQRYRKIPSERKENLLARYRENQRRRRQNDELRIADNARRRDLYRRKRLSSPE